MAAKWQHQGNNPFDRSRNRAKPLYPLQTKRKIKEAPCERIKKYAAKSDCESFASFQAYVGNGFGSDWVARCFIVDEKLHKVYDSLYDITNANGLGTDRRAERAVGKAKKTETSKHIAGS